MGSGRLPPDLSGNVGSLQHGFHCHVRTFKHLEATRSPLSGIDWELCFIIGVHLHEIGMGKRGREVLLV